MSTGPGVIFPRSMVVGTTELTSRSNNGQKTDGFDASVLLDVAEVVKETGIPADRLTDELQMTVLVPQPRKDEWAEVPMSAPRLVEGGGTTGRPTLAFSVHRDDGFSGKQLMAGGAAYGLMNNRQETLGWLQGPGNNASVQDSGLGRPSTQLKLSSAQMRSRADIRAELTAFGAPAKDINDALALRDMLATRSKAVRLTPQQGDIDEPAGQVGKWQFITNVNNPGPQGDAPIGGNLSLQIRRMVPGFASDLWVALSAQPVKTASGWSTSGEVWLGGANVPNISLGTVTITDQLIQ
jgi:hypothetical protein